MPGPLHTCEIICRGIIDDYYGIVAHLDSSALNLKIVTVFSKRRGVWLITVPPNLKLGYIILSMLLTKLLAIFSALNRKEVRIGVRNGRIIDMSSSCNRVRAETVSLNPTRASFDVISHLQYGVTQPQRGRCILQLKVHTLVSRILSQAFTLIT